MSYVLLARTVLQCTMSYVRPHRIVWRIRQRKFYVRYRIRCDVLCRTCYWQEQYFHILWQLCRTLRRTSRPHCILYRTSTNDIAYDIAYDIIHMVDSDSSYIVYDIGDESYDVVYDVTDDVVYDIVSDISLYSIRYCMWHRIRYRILTYDIVSWHTTSHPVVQYRILAGPDVLYCILIYNIVSWRTISCILTYEIVYDIV